MKVEFLEERSVPSATLLKDINTHTGFALPSNSSTAQYHDRLYFFADDGVHGRELWSTDGTAGGTAMVTDLNPGAGGSLDYSNSQNLVVAGDKLVFTANDGANLKELWSTDGTAAGTHRLTTFAPKPEVGPPNAQQQIDKLVAFNGKAYFSADDGTHGQELWSSDGTAAGTAMVLDVNATSGAAGTTNSSMASSLTVAGGKLYFSADDGVHGNELWATDGQTAPHLVKDLAPNDPKTPGVPGSSVLANLHAVGSKLFFTDFPAGTGTAYVTDGTAAGTKALPAVTEFVNMDHFAAVGDTLYFTTTPIGASGMHLWKTDGTNAGTKILYLPGVSGSIGGLASANGKLFVNATPGFNTQQFVVTDGTVAGTSTLHTFSGVPSIYYLLGTHGNAVYFGSGQELWRSDGTAAGTKQITVNGTAATVALGLNPVAVQFHGKDYVVADDGVHGSEMWQTDGTAAGTQLLKDINAVTDGSSPNSAVAVGGTVYFTATDGSHFAESSYTGALWKTDGTSAGTTLVKDLRAPGTITNDLSITRLTAFHGAVYFLGSDGVHGQQLWTSDGTAAGTVALSQFDPAEVPGGALDRPFVVGNALYFARSAPSLVGNGLWKSDGTAAGTVLVHAFTGARYASLGEMTDAGGKMFFTANDGVHGQELWTSDGTEAGTVLVKDIFPGTGPYGSNGSNPSNLVALNGKVYFNADDGIHGGELWVSDGTASGTTLVKDVRPGAGGAFDWTDPTGATYPQMIAAGGKLFFNAADGVHGQELWVSDGTAVGTHLVSNIHADGAGMTGASIAGLTDVNGTVFFTADDGIHGSELWKTDGTAAGTALVKDILPGTSPVDGQPLSSGPNGLTNIGGRLYFAANNGTGGQVWTSDGTAAGTVAKSALTVQAGSGTGLMSQWFAPIVTPAAAGLMFIVDDGLHGAEPWVLSPDTAAPVLQVQGAAFEATVGQQFNRNVASFTDVGGPTDAAHYAATIDWGDGSTSAGTVLKDGGQFQVAGAHKYAAAGSFTVQVAVSADGGPAVTGSATATVHMAAAPGTGVYAAGNFVRQTEARSFTVAVASFRPRNPAAGAADFTAAIDWGDGTSSAGTIMLRAAGDFDVVGTHAYAKAGAYSINVRIVSGGVTTNVTTNAKIDAAAITVRGLAATATATQSSPLTLATFRDADRTAKVGQFTAMIDWADGSSSAGAIASDGHGAFVVTGSHTYSHTGQYAARVTIADGVGHTGQATASVRVMGAA